MEFYIDEIFIFFIMQINIENIIMTTIFFLILFFTSTIQNNSQIIGLNTDIAFLI